MTNDFISNLISFKMDGSDREDITISDNNSYDFQWDLILYALQPDRLLFIDNVEFWGDFHSGNQANSDKYYEETPEQLCEYFIQKLLPQINNYDLNEGEENLLSLLDLHPGYRRTEDGFVKTDVMETIEFRRDPGETLANSNQHENAPDNLVLANNRDLNYQVVITPHDGGQHSDQELSKENATFLSVALCSDADLPLCQLLGAEDIKKRLRGAKQLFEQNGQQLENINCLVEDLVAKLKTLCELKETIAELVQKQF